MNLVAYYRVSTARQGASGLGLDAQRAAVAQFVNGDKLVAEFVEVESGKRDDRPKLTEALRACKLYSARLIIAKLDRLARSVAFISNLMESGVEFVACDFPQANRLTIHILAAVAEHEAAAISARTKAALAQAKARGVKLGNPSLRPGTAEGAAAASAANVARAQRRHDELRPVIEAIRSDGLSSLQGLAKELNARGISTPGGRGQWTATAVSRVLATAAG